MAEAFIVRRGGGGGSGGTLVVTSSGAGTVTVSNSTLGKSYSKIVTAGGSVTFKGLKTGTWTVTLSNGTQPPATKTVTINADYSTSIAYFAATISITYPAESTCVVTNSSGETVASDMNTGSSTKTWTATVNATGTYTITATSTSDSSKAKSTTVSITADGQSESVTLSYELVLFDNGSYDDVTGGWSGIKDNLLYADGYSGNQYEDGKGYFYTNNKIDLSDYTVLHFIVKQATGDKYKYVGYRNSQASDQNVGEAAITVEVSTPTEYTIDISSQTGSYYIGGDVRGTTTLNSVYCSRVWLT